MLNTIEPVTREYANTLSQSLGNELTNALRARLKLATKDERCWLSHRIQVVIHEIKSLIEVM